MLLAAVTIIVCYFMLPLHEECGKDVMLNSASCQISQFFSIVARELAITIKNTALTLLLELNEISKNYEKPHCQHSFIYLSIHYFIHSPMCSFIYKRVVASIRSIN